MIGRDSVEHKGGIIFLLVLIEICENFDLYTLQSVSLPQDLLSSKREVLHDLLLRASVASEAISLQIVNVCMYVKTCLLAPPYPSCLSVCLSVWSSRGLLHVLIFYLRLLITSHQ